MTFKNFKIIPACAVRLGAFDFHISKPVFIFLVGCFVGNRLLYAFDFYISKPVFIFLVGCFVGNRLLYAFKFMLLKKKKIIPVCAIRFGVFDFSISKPSFTFFVFLARLVNIFYSLNDK
jgi:uncharacterized membrane protein